MKKTIAIIGTGHLGTSIIERLIKNKHKRIIATARRKEKLEELKKRFPDITLTMDNYKAAINSDIIILTTKESSFEEVSEQIKEACKNKLVISLGPTCSLKRLSKLFCQKSVRLMTPVDAREDIVCYCINKKCSAEDEGIVRQVFGPHCVKVQEAQMPVLTAYTVLRGVTTTLFEPLVEIGKRNGLDRKLAQQVVGIMLTSTGEDILRGYSAQERLRKASGGMNPHSFTLRLAHELEPVRKEIWARMSEVCMKLKG